MLDINGTDFPLFSEVKKSAIAVGVLFEKSNKSYSSKRKKNQRIQLKNDSAICYIKTGRVSVYCEHNDLLMFSVDAPAILGLPQILKEVNHHYLRSDTECEMCIISASEAKIIINENNLWSHAFTLLTWYLHLYFHHDTLINKPCKQSMINEHLKFIWGMDAEERARISVYSFIMSRNYISRSGIHKSLQALINSGSIKISNGKLVYYKEDMES